MRRYGLREQRDTYRSLQEDDPFNLARRSFAKDDLFFREFIFAKCWEQGIHRRYVALLLSDEWAPLRERLHKAFDEPVHQRWKRN